MAGLSYRSRSALLATGKIYNDHPSDRVEQASELHPTGSLACPTSISRKGTSNKQCMRESKERLGGSAPWVLDEPRWGDVVSWVDLVPFVVSLAIIFGWFEYCTALVDYQSPIRYSNHLPNVSICWEPGQSPGKFVPFFSLKVNRTIPDYHSWPSFLPEPSNHLAISICSFLILLSEKILL